MQDGLTRKLSTRSPGSGDSAPSANCSYKLVVVSGPQAGMEYELERARVTLGRGPGVDLAFADSAMSRQHAAFDWAEDRFRVQDLGSTNGLRINGNRVLSSDLGNGDHLEIGTLVFQLVVVERQQQPDVYDLSVDR